MKCERCQGLMFEDHFMDMNDISEGMWISSWRCMNCGHAVDPVMAANRERQTLRQADREQGLHQSDAVLPWMFSESESPSEGVTMMICPGYGIEMENDSFLDVKDL